MASPKRVREANFGRILAAYQVTTSGVATPSLPGDTDGIALAMVQVSESGVPINSGGSGASVSFTRPNNTTAYGAGAVLGPSTSTTAALEFTNMGPSTGGEIMLTTSNFEIDVSSIPSGMTSFVLHFYSSTPPSAYADGATFDLPSGDRSVYLGNVNIGSPVDLGSTLYVNTTQLNQQLTLTGSSLFAYLVTTTGYTPTAQAEKKITLHDVKL